MIVTMRKPIALLLIAALAACGDAVIPANDAAAQVSRSESEVVITTGTPVTLADLSIDGMTCAMGCGSTIKSALAKLPGVSGAEVNFTEAGQTNHVVVTYDPARVNDADLVKAVQSIHNGDYKVVSVGITKQVLKQGASDAPAEGEQDPQVNASLESVALPSIIALLERLVRI
jgi:periplasmic mercuric ion binding protein